MQDNEQQISKLKEQLRKLKEKRYKRFNVMIFNKTFEKLSQEAEKRNKSKAKMLGEMINNFKI